MIKKSLITAFVLLLAYHFALPHLSRDYYWIPGQQRANYIRAQQYVNDSPSEVGVVVGSSMSNELSEEILGKDFVKLTFPAGGSFTGLDIIERSGKRPEFVLIEINMLLRATDDGLLDDSTSAWRRKLRTASPMFKEEGRPSNFQVGFLKGIVEKACNGFARIMNGGKKPEPVPPPPMDPEVMKEVMRANRDVLGKPVPGEDLAARVKRMGELVDGLAGAGTRCVFYEMPIDRTLVDLSSPAAVRKAMVDRFPKDKYDWIGIDPSRDYETSDGIHLVRPDADEVTRQILDAVEKLK
jgi:hypothetical protein